LRLPYYIRSLRGYREPGQLPCRSAEEVALAVAVSIANSKAFHLVEQLVAQGEPLLEPAFDLPQGTVSIVNPPAESASTGIS
jgi:hypothetical protein